MRRNNSLGELDDVVFVDPQPEKAVAERAVAAPPIDDRPSPERALIGMNGQYSLQSWRDADGNPRLFDCKVVKIASRGIELAVPVTGPVGEWVCVHFDKFGRFEGPIIKAGQRSLIMRIVATFEETQKIAGKIAWVENKEATDSREHDRFVPADPNSSVMLPNGSFVPCQILDYSASGTAVTSSFEPELGLVLKVGKVIGRVVRLFEGGFGVRFAVLQDTELLESRLKPKA